MVAAFYAELERTTSLERLKPFRTPGADDFSTAVNYFWNISLCQSLYPSLNMLEVALRNSLHTCFSIKFNRQDWYDQPHFLQSREREDVRIAKGKVTRSNKPVTPGRVVAALTFGTWVSLLDSLYGDNSTGPQIWGPFPSPNLALVFPNAPTSFLPYRRRLHGRIDDLRLFRNRISHYEPVWHGMLMPSRARKRGGFQVHVSLNDLHTQILETIGWISPAMEMTMTNLDAFPMTEQKGRMLIERRLKRQLGIV